MIEKYTASEVLEMVIKAKEKGINMYMELARASENYHVSQLFADLAKDEQHHKMKLREWCDSFSKDISTEAYPGERVLFLKSLADKNTFNCDAATKKALEKTISEEDAIKAGVDFEKDFLIFLHDLKDKVGSADVDVLKKLIDEEMSHMRKLLELT